MKWTMPIFLFLSVFAVTLNYDAYTTAPSPLESQGYLYITFCSTDSSTHTFDFTPEGFSISPRSISIDFSGSSTNQDCQQVVAFVSSDEPGMYNLGIEMGSTEWTLPVQFSKQTPLSVSLSKSALHTGYDSARLYVSGDGEDAWVYIGASIVGINKFHTDSLPATFPLTFHFTSAGFYSVPVSVKYNKNDLTIMQNYTFGIRVEEAPVKVGGNLAVPSDGYADLTFNLTLPEEIYSGIVSLTSDCLEGGKSQVIENFQSGELQFKVKGTCDPGIYELMISAGDFQTKVPLTITGPEGFELFTNTFVKDDEHTLEVTIANEGSQTMKAVSIRLLPGDYSIVKEGSFLGDLEFGDFDSAELIFIPKNDGVTVNYQVAYTIGGEKIVLEKTYPYSYSKTSSKLRIYLLLALLIGGYYAWRRKSSH